MGFFEKWRQKRARKIDWKERERAIRELREAILEWMAINRAWGVVSACDDPVEVRRQAAEDAHRKADKVAYLAALAMSDRLPEWAASALFDRENWSVPARCVDEWMRG